MGLKNKTGLTIALRNDLYEKISSLSEKSGKSKASIIEDYIRLGMEAEHQGLGTIALSVNESQPSYQTSQIDPTAKQITNHLKDLSKKQMYPLFETFIEILEERYELVPKAKSESTSSA